MAEPKHFLDLDRLDSTTLRTILGLGEDWPHRDECIRVSYVQDEEQVRRGIGLIAAVVREAYDSG